MSIELRSDLQPTADILRNSLLLRADEKAPAVPAGLFEDLSARFVTGSARPARPLKVSLFAKIQSFVSAPAFGMSAAALVILAVVLPMAVEKSGNTAAESFRGGPADNGATASSSIILIGAPQDIVSSLGNSGDFEKGSIFTADTVSGAKVIVDFNAATITAITSDGRAVHTAALTVGKPDLSAAIAEALSKL